jgi:hypothetical protein
MQGAYREHVKYLAITREMLDSLATDRGKHIAQAMQRM